MSFTPLLAASPLIQIHVLCAVLALVLGPFILFGKKGNSLHKLLGRTWGLGMVGTIVSSYFIFGIRLWGPFSPIHLLSALSTYTLVSGIYFARTGQVQKHQSAMRALYFGGLIVAGLFTLMPGRIMHRVVFGNIGEFWAYVTLAAVFGAAVFARVIWRGRQENGL